MVKVTDPNIILTFLESCTTQKDTLNTVYKALVECSKLFKQHISYLKKKNMKI